MFGKDVEPYKTRALPLGDLKGFLEDSGYGIHFNTHYSRSIQLRDSKGRVLASAPSLRGLPDVFPDGKWRRVRVDVLKSSGHVRVFYEDSEVINAPVDLTRPLRGIGFGAATGELYYVGGTAEQSIRNVIIRKLDSNTAPSK
jgi:hypothetical protein